MKENNTIKFPMRINKYLSHKGIATRLQGDEMIRAGLIFINAKKAILGDKVMVTDKVTLSKNMHEKRYLYLAYNKPVGVSTDKQKGSKSILETKHFPGGVFPVGRLDKESEGLIILTNDGRVTDRLLNPIHEHEKEYLITTNKEVQDSVIASFTKGVVLDDGYRTKPAKLKKLGGTTFSIIISEGKNRQIRRMCEKFGLHVKTLKRLRVMNVVLGTLKPTEFQELKSKERELFLKNLGLHKK